jgi:S-adenosylmethionine:tRNA ribosyltransferase-isomerase
VSALAFRLPSALEADAPPERRGLRRDQVRLMVAEREAETIDHARFDELTEHLRAGDLLVINVSATLPAAISGRRRDGAAVRVHVSTRAPALGEDWRVIELRTPDGGAPVHGRAGEVVALAPDGGAAFELVAPYTTSTRLLLARYSGPEPLSELLARHGEPIRYGYAAEPWPLSDYQTVYATVPGSAEMPSAGRPFTPELIVALLARGVAFAPVLLHCGVSSPERHEAPFPEYYEVPRATARLIETTRRGGGRVIAVGTTVVRALETVGEGAGRGWSDVVVTPERGVSVVDGLITGWHEPAASHLQMLEAIAGAPLLARCYDAALAHGYLWHEFGDSHLLLP